MWGSLIAGGLAWITGGSKAADKTLDTGTSMLDKAFYTDQEKATNQNKILDWYLKYQQATGAQNVARRIIAVMVTGLWAFVILVMALARLFSTDYSDWLFKVLTDVIMQPFSIIIGFYFLTHVLRGLKKE